MAISAPRTGIAVALVAAAALTLTACSDPGASAASAPSSSASTAVGGKTFNLSPEQNRFPVTKDNAAAALVPEAVKADGKLTVEKFDFATYRTDLLGFYARATPRSARLRRQRTWPVSESSWARAPTRKPSWCAGTKRTRRTACKPVEFQYYDDDSASSLAVQSGRADLTFGPNAGAAYKAAKDGKTKQVGTVNGGWPLKADIAFTTKKGNGLAVAAQSALNTLIENGTYGKILDRWGLSTEAIAKSELNPAGLPKK